MDFGFPAFNFLYLDEYCKYSSESQTEAVIACGVISWKHLRSFYKKVLQIIIIYLESIYPHTNSS